MIGTKISTSKSKKVKIDFCFYQKCTKMAKISHFSAFLVEVKINFDFFDLDVDIFMPIIHKVENNV